MISDEYMLKAAARMQDAANRSNAAADRMEAAVQRIAFLFEDGYGGNGLKLIELLEKSVAMTDIKEALDCLQEVRRLAINLRFGRGKTPPVLQSQLSKDYTDAMEKTEKILAKHNR